METTKQGDFSVHRSLVLPDMGDDDVEKIQACLKALPGMQQVVFDPGRRKLALTYDASRLGFWSIEQALTEAGWPPSRDRWARMRYAWYRYLDENARANAEARGACCSNPSDIYAKRHK